MPSILLFLALPMAHAAPDTNWVADATRASGVDGHRAAPLTLARWVEPHCATQPLACAWASAAAAGSAEPLRGVADAAANACGDTAPVACLVHAWALGMEPSSGEWRPAAEVDGEEVRRALGLACDGGVARACVELGWTEHLAIGTYANPDDAAKRWAELCEGGEGAACRALAATAEEPEAALEPLAKALELADPRAVLLASDHLEDDELLPPLQGACDAGVAQACVQTARRRDGSERLARLEQGCATTDPEACARFALASGGTVEEVEATLRGLAPQWPRAATWAGLVKQGAALDPFTEPADPLAVHQEALDYDVRKGLWGCYLAMLPDHDVEGWVDVDLLTDAAGDVVDAAVEGVAFDDDGFHSCAAVELLGARPITTGGVPRLAHARVSLAHTARVEVLPIVEDVKGLTVVSASMKEWADDLSHCAAGRERVRADSVGIYRVKVKRSGELLPGKTLLSTEYVSVDTCVLETLLGRSTGPVVTPLKVDLRLTFLQPRVLPEPEQVFRTEPVAFSGTPTPFKVLLWFVDDLEVGRERAKFTKSSEASVVAAFEEAAAFAAEHSGGAVDVQVEARHAGGVGLAGIGDRRRGTLTWNVTPGDLPYDAVRTLERDTWDAVMVWAPIPRGLPRPFGYVAWTQSQLHGASLATSTLEEGRELLMFDGTDASVFALQMIYDAWSTRAERLLGVSLPPNDRHLRFGERGKLDPRIGRADDPLDFYRHVFYNHLSADLWQDMRRATHEVHDIQENNLAYLARPVGKDRLRNAHLMVDGVWEAGDYQVAAIDPEDPDDDGPRGTWMGLRWDASQQLGRVRGRIHTEETSPELQVQIHISGRWKGVGSVRPDAEGVFDYAWPGSDTDGVRIQLKAEGDVEVDELEAYAPE